MALTGLTIFKIFVSIISYMVQASAAKKIRAEQARRQREAEARADAAKGVQLTVTGSPSELYVCYGRQLVGGNEVFHSTRSSFVAAAPAIGGSRLTVKGPETPGQIWRYDGSNFTSVSFESVFNKTGFIWYRYPLSYASGSVPANTWVATDYLRVSSEEFIAWNILSYDYIRATTDFAFFEGDVTMPPAAITLPPKAYASPPLSGNVSGDRHEFLTVQQALCVKGINRILDVKIDDMPLSTPKFGYGISFNTYPDGNVVDPLVLANASGRENALFFNAAYSTNVFRLNRDDSQYNGVPEVKFVVEGMKVRNISGAEGSRFMHPDRAYSNNPALCLLDYLTNGVYGRGIHIDKIDLDSFYKAFVICDVIVATGKPLDGMYWSNAGLDHNIKRFETNISLPTGKTLRENIENLLESMAYAELVWASGKYKLVLDYPVIYNADISVSYALNEVVQTSELKLYRSLVSNNISKVLTDTSKWVTDVIAAEITDDDLMMGSENPTTWPDAQSRFNFGTVKFLNEAKDFSEDSVSWPPKHPNIANGNIRGIWATEKTYEINDMVVYGGDLYKATKNKPIQPWTGAGKSYGIDDSATVLGVQYRSLINHVSTGGIENGGTGNAPNIIVQSIWIKGGFRAPTIESGAWQITTTPATSLNSEVELSVYKTYLTKDNGIQLETEFFEEGTTDYWHALAKAEQRVRSSRDTTQYGFKLAPEMFVLEPGDIIRVTSDTLQIPGELLKISSIKVLDDGSLEVDAFKFGAELLAWNVPDGAAQSILARNIFDDYLGQATELAFIVNTTALLSLGKLTWTKSADVRVNLYIVKYTTDADITASSKWVELGRVEGLSFQLPIIYGAVGSFIWFTVVAAGGTRTAPYRDPLTSDGWPMVQSLALAAEIASITLTLAANFSSANLELSWKTPTIEYAVWQYEIRYGVSWGDSAATSQMVFADALVVHANWGGTRRYWVAAVDGAGNMNTPTYIDVESIQPSLPTVTQAFVLTNLVLSWNDIKGSLPIAYYEIWADAPIGAQPSIVPKVISTIQVLANRWESLVDWGGTRDFYVRGVDTAGVLSAIRTVATTIAVMGTPIVTQEFSVGSLLLSWVPLTGTLPVKYYEVWADSPIGIQPDIVPKIIPVTEMAVTTWGTVVDWGNDRSFYVRGIDSAGNIGATLAVEVTIVSPNIPNVAQEFLLGDLSLRWLVDTTATLPISYYEFHADDPTGIQPRLPISIPIIILYTTSWRQVVNWGGSRDFHIFAVDTAGNKGPISTTTVVIENPVATTITSVVVDNNILLYWKPSARSLPLDHFRLSKVKDGVTTIIGSLHGYFATIFETTAGVFTYTIVMIDSAGNIGAARSLDVTVAQPTDFVLHDDRSSTLQTSAVPANTVTASGVVRVDPYVDEDYTTESYTKLELLLDTTDTYEEIMDFGTILASNKCDVTLDTIIDSGEPEVVIAISSSLDNLTYTAPIVSGSVALYDFRYVKVELTMAGTGGVVLRGIRTTLSSKKVSEAGIVDAVAADVDGTLVVFEQSYIDVTNIMLTAGGVIPRIAIYDFVDVPNPVSFKVLLFDTAGVRVSGPVSYAASGAS